MSNKVAVVNSALITLGETAISSFSDSSVAATAANIKWDIARRATLRLHPWNFAVRRRQLAQSTTTPVWKYDYRYTMPSELLKLLEVENNKAFRIEGRDIFTNRKECFIRYIYDNEDVATWDASFVDLMVARMAYELAYTLPRSRPMIDTMYTLYQQRLMEAKAQDSQEDITNSIYGELPELIANRYHGGGTFGR